MNDDRGARLKRFVDWYGAPAEICQGDLTIERVAVRLVLVAVVLAWWLS
jgi:hypothetical protein